MYLSVLKTAIVAYGVWFELGVMLVREISKSWVVICFVG